MRAMRRFRNRKGVFVVLFGILFTVLMAAGAIAIDFSRIWAMRNELQTAADAAALSGAVQLNKPPKNLYFDVDTAARGIASKNLAMGAPTTVDSVVWGQWQDNTTPPHFNPGVVPANAVQAWVSHSTRGLIMQALGITAPTVHANAIAWADAPISTTNCIRPWAIPYEVLMGRVNLLRTDDPSISGDPYSRANLTRPFDPINDMNALRNGDPANLRFTLKLGQNSNANNGSIDEGSLVNGQPGNFQAVALPKYWDFATQSLANPGPNRGGSAYSDAIAGKNCYSIAIGDSLMTETGNKVGPTVSAADKSNNQTAPYGICDSIIDDKQDPVNNGKCMNAANPNGYGVEIKAAFYFCPSSCAGRSVVGVNLLGSFTLEKIYPNGDTGPTPQCDRSQIVGVFNPVSDIGPIGGTSSTLYKIILVK
jgi:putative Flp pilus-assembly TadE/G-like protein